MVITSRRRIYKSQMELRRWMIVLLCRPLTLRLLRFFVFFCGSFSMRAADCCCWLWRTYGALKINFSSLAFISSWFSAAEAFREHRLGNGFWFSSEVLVPSSDIIWRRTLRIGRIVIKVCCIHNAFHGGLNGRFQCAVLQAPPIEAIEPSVREIIIE